MNGLSTGHMTTNSCQADLKDMTFDLWGFS